MMVRLCFVCVSHVFQTFSTEYRLIQIHEVWHFDWWSCGAEGDLFRGYIEAWLKKKQEASGYPLSVKTAAKKRIQGGLLRL
jgi:hypothetical protein